MNVPLYAVFVFLHKYFVGVILNLFVFLYWRFPFWEPFFMKLQPQVLLIIFNYHPQRR